MLTLPNQLTQERSAATRRRIRARGLATIAVAAILALVVAGAGAGFYAWSQYGRVSATLTQSAANAGGSLDSKPLTGLIGWIDAPAAEAVIGPTVTISGWALDSTGIRGVEIRVGGRTFPAKIGVARPDVAQLKPGYPDNARAGFEFTGDFSPYPAPPGTDRRELAIVAIAADGRETVLGTRSLIEPAAQSRWRGQDQRARLRPPFYLLPALSGIGVGGARELDTQYTPYLSATARAGMRVPILYLRSTKGEAGDYVFDPDWDIGRRCGERVITEDSLNRTIAEAVQRQLPVLFTLNGGIWADAACDIPAWDINDQLEQDTANCQWNEKNEVMPDDYLKRLPGSQNAPELARSLSFNVYAQKVRYYKRRNLQAAGRIILDFARAHPNLFVGINLDPDTYLNPFFDQQQWYDYNPGTLKQFRHWLAATGPYAGRAEPGVPDLRAYRRARSLALADVSRLAGRRFMRWDDVDPPRSFPREPKDGRPAFWDDPWTREWETFRRHLVDLHYDELSQWLNEVGVGRDRIWTSQGFMAPHPDALPFAIHVTSPMKNYDTGGMSIEGAVPKGGHLGAILYGGSAINEVRMEEPQSLFATFRALDPGWAIVEYNTADLRNPDAQPTYGNAYRGLRDMFNYGARYVSPMAWNGSNGINAGKPGYVTFTAWRNTPLEEAARDFLLSHANVPLGARLWTFGTPRYASADGWTAAEGTITLGTGWVALAPVNGRFEFVSPRELALAPGTVDRMVLGLTDPAALTSIRVLGRIAANAPWRAIAVIPKAAALRTTPAGTVVPLAWPRGLRTVDQVKVELRFGSDAAQTLVRVALWPAPSS